MKSVEFGLVARGVWSLVWFVGTYGRIYKHLQNLYYLIIRIAQPSGALVSRLYLASEGRASRRLYYRRCTAQYQQRAQSAESTLRPEDWAGREWS